MTTKDALESIDRSIKAIQESSQVTAQAVMGIKEALVSLNDHSIFHLQETQDNARKLEGINTTLVKQQTLQERLINEIKFSNRIFKFIIIFAMVALATLAGFEKGVKLWKVF